MQASPVSWAVHLVRSLCLLLVCLGCLTAACTSAVRKPSSEPGSDHYQGYTDGFKEAKSRVTSKGFFADEVRGNEDDLEPALKLLGRSNEYVEGFKDGYQDGLRAEKKSCDLGFVIGGGLFIVGFFVWLLVLSPVSQL